MKPADMNEKNLMTRQAGQPERGNLTVDLDSLMPMIREQLAAGRTVCFTPTGISMKPMLRHGRDKVLLAPVPEALKKYDLVLYQRTGGQYVLHRIVKVEAIAAMSAEASHTSDAGSAPDANATPDGGLFYTCVGDNQFVKEPGLTHGQMIGIVTEFWRGGRRHTVGQIGYKIYCRLWHCSRGLRYFWKRALGKLLRLCKRIVAELRKCLKRI